MIDILEEVRKEQGELVALRRHFHEHPELSKKEDQTLAYIAKKLEEYGISYRLVDKGGLIAWIDGKGPGKTLLLRADVDALPIEEGERNLSCPRVCRSQNHGVMHACGHDGHMAMQLMAAKCLQRWKDQWDGTVVLMFERGEEESGPLEYLLRYLETESPWHIDACYATHVRWDIPAGKVSLENEMIPKWLSEGRALGGFVNDGYFIDIGIPEAYYQFIEDVEKGVVVW